MKEFDCPRDDDDSSEEFCCNPDSSLAECCDGQALTDSLYISNDDIRIGASGYVSNVNIDDDSVYVPNIDDVD